jgi:hypothetical protein
MRRLLRGFKYFIKKEGSVLKNLVEFVYFVYKRNRWMLDFFRYWNDFDDIKIDRPVFLLGVHGGGLTLISRIIRRHKDFVSVSGNYKYWTGADEMATVLDSILPADIAGVKHKIPEESGLKAPTTWLYATNKNLNHFRKNSKGIRAEIKRKFRKILRWQISRHAINKDKARFIDKSQIYTIRILLLNEILKDTDPKFLLITRNPYVLCYRIANSDLLSFKHNNIKSYKERLEVACQHWRNSIECALKDSKQIENFMTVKFEDVLKEPEKNIKKICDFIEIDFDEDLLPQPEHKIPFGSKGKNKWYPLRPNVNEKYFDKISKEDVKTIDKYVGQYANKLGYSKPDIKD